LTGKEISGKRGSTEKKVSTKSFPQSEELRPEIFENMQEK
jgi:hypothetical protein